MFNAYFTYVHLPCGIPLKYRHMLDTRFCWFIVPHFCCPYSSGWVRTQKALKFGRWIITLKPTICICMQYNMIKIHTHTHTYIYIYIHYIFILVTYCMNVHYVCLCAIYIYIHIYIHIYIYIHTYMHSYIYICVCVLVASQLTTLCSYIHIQRGGLLIHPFWRSWRKSHQALEALVESCPKEEACRILGKWSWTTEPCSPEPWNPA